MKNYSYLIQRILPGQEYYPTTIYNGLFKTLPTIFSIGTLDILKQQTIALFCSRKCPGDAILKAYDFARELREKETPVIGGFHTPVEKDMLEILLKGKGPIVICPARGLEGMRIPKAWSQGIEQGRIILVSMFDQRICRVTNESAHQRNILVASLATTHLFVQIAEGGSLDALSKELRSRQFTKM